MHPETEYGFCVSITYSTNFNMHLLEQKYTAWFCTFIHSITFNLWSQDTNAKQ